MPLAATHRNFKRNASSATGARHNSVHASQRGRGGVGRSGACSGPEVHHGTQCVRRRLFFPVTTIKIPHLR